MANRFPRKQFLQRIPWYVGSFSLLVFFPMTLSSGFDLWEVFYCWLFAPFIALVLVGLAIYNRRMIDAAILVAFCGLAWLLFVGRDAIRDRERWMFYSRSYKAKVLAQRASPGELQHTLWDGWGFAGNDNDVFLVYDPKNSLAAPASRYDSSGTFSGIVCPVYKVSRLSNQWYAVYFYTETSWGAC